MLRDGFAFRGQLDSSVPVDAQIPAPCHALECSGDGRWCDAKIFGKARADGLLLFLNKLPDRFQVVFLRDAGLFTTHNSMPWTWPPGAAIQSCLPSCAIARPTKSRAPRYHR